MNKLYDAIENNQIDIIKDLNIDLAMDDNWAIRRASEKGYLALVKFLIAQPNVDATARDNYAIGHAARNGHMDVAIFLASLPRVCPTHFTLWNI